MLFLRSLLYFIGSIISLIVITLCGLFLVILPYSYRQKFLSNWAIFCIWWLKISLNITTDVKGSENINSSPSVIISNHQSTWETLAFQTIFPAHTWVLKQELLWLPVFGWSLALLKPIVINRGDKLNAIKKVIKQGSERLSQGISVVVFPEGTRQTYKHLGDYQNGAAAIAKKSGHDIIPVYHNAGKFWPKGSFIKKPGVITVVIGKAISSSSLTSSELTKEVRNWTLEQEKKLL
ncbi:1-acyl-sn-glycerol-3-phosphate acyltransferase [Candidatus Thioglobus sp. NP1]|uniref:lysophospholipid acyltransferase family protein n=1 Tax=Candidatus Thioglobus sp. NP1 TaxID=2508687 RepID=UPI00157E1EE0|nr:lysophospholipid acyltransferase family protein [Candidatus Thioglobus sp. NP1]